MIVKPLAFTICTDEAYDLLDPKQPDGTWTHDRDHLAEVAGRNCYQAWSRPNPKTATNEGYLRNIQNHEHFSVLEHATMSFYVEGVSRSLLVELERHRHLSFSVQSQRYVDETGSTFIEPPLFDELRQATDSGADYDPRYESVMDAIDEIIRTADAARRAYAKFVNAATNVGVPRKQAREAARSILPGGTETRMVVSGNIRAWRWVIHMRHSEQADAEIRAFAAEILKHLRYYAPHSVQDISDKPRS